MKIFKLIAKVLGFSVAMYVAAGFSVYAMAYLVGFEAVKEGHISVKRDCPTTHDYMMCGIAVAMKGITEKYPENSEDARRWLNKHFDYEEIDSFQEEP